VWEVWGGGRGGGGEREMLQYFTTTH
jgi:hypothetical protein